MNNTPFSQDEGGAFKALYDVVARLRAPGGCPWDREQNPKSLRGDLIEETYECVEAIDEGEPAHIKEELGDVFLLATMISYMHEEEGAFTVGEVLAGLREKLIRRHPHVFGEVTVKDSAEALDNWARIKVEQEGRKPGNSLLDGVSRGIPPLDRAYKLQKKAARGGFDWPGLEGVCAKIREELAEVEEAAAAAGTENGNAGVPGEAPEKTAGGSAGAVEAELGDLLFSVVNLCRYLHVEPSVCLNRANAKFTRRFTHVEKRMREQGGEMKKENLALMDAFWEEAKRGEKSTPALE